MNLKDDWLTDDELLSRRTDELAAANERIKELEAKHDHAYDGWERECETANKLRQQLAAERAVSDRLLEAYRLATGSPTTKELMKADAIVEEVEAMRKENGE